MTRLFLSMTLLAFAAAPAAAADYKLSPANTKVGFTGTKPDGKHTGTFDAVTGTASVDANDATTMSIKADIDMTKFTTDAALLTVHLKGADFFNVKTHPKASFATTKVVKDGDSYKVTGDLTLCGKTKAVTFPAKIAATEKGLTVSAAFKIDRNDWGIVYGKGKIDPDVAITLDIKAAK